MPRSDAGWPTWKASKGFHAFPHIGSAGQFPATPSPRDGKHPERQSSVGANHRLKAEEYLPLKSTRAREADRAAR